MSSKRVVRTSDGLAQLLIRHGITPTMNSKRDVELAREFMPITYNQRLAEIKTMEEEFKNKKLFDLAAEVFKNQEEGEIKEEIKSQKRLTLEDVKLLSLDDVVEIVFYSKASIYRLMDEGKFPKPVRLGGRSVFWVQSEIIEFMQNWINQPR